jgi:hypothetical protein
VLASPFVVEDLTAAIEFFRALGIRGPEGV